jgi:hypothetical protein
VFREIHFCNKIEEILAPYGVQCGNSPVGVWEYSDKISNAVNECPNLKKYCGIFKTLGEKRLATNLI